MNANWRVAEGKLAEFWRVDPSTMIGWRNDGRLDSDVKEDAEHGFHHYYYISSVDAYHAAHSTGFGLRPIPGFAELRQSEPALLVAEEAAQLLGCSLDSLLASVRRGELPAFRLGPESLRLPAALVRIRASIEQGAVDVGTAARVLCVKPTGVQTLMRSGRLASTKRTGKGQEKYVEYDSLIGLLATLIPAYISPEVWWEKMLSTQGEPITKGQLVAKHHVHKRTVNRLIAQESRSLPCIRTTGDTPWTMIPPWGVATFLQEERVQLTPQELAAIFGGSPGQARQWQRPYSICNRPHGQSWNRCPALSCVREYITANSTHAELDADAWLVATLQLGMGALNSDQLIAMTPGLCYPDITQAIMQGELGEGVWLPPQDGRKVVALSRSKALRFRQTWQQAA